MIFGVIYLITCLVNGMRYVGQTTRTVERRFKEHTKTDSFLGKEIKKYGEEKFIIEILETCETRKQLNEREIFWIAELKCKHPSGYNCTDGGEGNNPCDATRAKQSASAKKRCEDPSEIKRRSMTQKGRKLSYKTRARMSVSHTGKKHSEKSKAIMSVVKKGWKPSAETLANMSAGQTKRYQNPDERAKASFSRIKNINSPKYPILLAELMKQKITYNIFAKHLGLSQPTISNKMGGNGNFSLAQMEATKKFLGVNVPIEELFRKA